MFGRAQRIRIAFLAVTAALAGLAVGCGAREETPDLINGKRLFIGEGTCGACHALERAGTGGTQGPDLDEAFGPARRDGIGRSTIQGVVREQIAHPLRNSSMPADLVTGEDARDVAAYVAAVAGVPGDDEGQLARAGIADAKDGEQIFRAAGCGGCHTLAAAGTSASAGPSLDELARVAPRRRSGMSARQYVREAILKPDAFLVPGFSPTMPDGYDEQLKDEQVKALVDFLLRAQGDG